MQTDNRLFDDLSRVATGAVGALAGMKREIEALVRQRVERVVGGLDLVSRDEFEATRAMAERARTENEELKARVAALEAALRGQSSPQAPASENGSESPTGTI
ncbi:accessory factor UbiK family protein [Pedomonas mirosovicensis]|uniref:accessory factor UbiK family protein n=1 Tax=Pedomonas mirosovicensis TaxID=2908641 RepID=UPI00216862DA|nr:accessory factor UbiK family protein [Pedomonas mirosovicensis]MCH8685446.1 accessory factor UbiK family protein [Pedomonas mirosovicensis]